MAPTADTPQNYAWAPAAGQEDLAFQAEELSNAMSELEFRAEFLAYLDESSSSVIKAEADNCEGAKQITKNAFEVAKATLDVVAALPVLGEMLGYVKEAIDNAFHVVDDTIESANAASYHAVNLAFAAAKSVLNAISFGPFKAVFAPIISTLDKVQTAVNSLVRCATGATKWPFQQDQCYDLANMYRIVVTQATKTSPALNLPAETSEDLKRLAAGSLSLLDLLDKSSVASTNEALLASRPIFAADVLDQFRIELLRVGNTQEIQNYAQVALGTVVGISNALEACLRVAADPVGAIDELNEELDALDDYDEEEEGVEDGVEADH